MKINLIRLASSLDPDKPYLKDSEKFLDDLNTELFEYDLELVENVNSPVSIVFIETGGSEQIFIKNYKKYKAPIILLSNCENNSLPATLEISTFLKSKNIPGIMIVKDDNYTAKMVSNAVNLVSGIANFENSKLGVIGKPSDWLIASTVDYQEVKKKFKIDLIDIEMEELYREIEKSDISKIKKKEEYISKFKNKKTVEEALKIYVALKSIVSKYGLKGLTLRCFDLLGKYKNTACLAFGMLNAEGVVATCEGDIPTLLTMHAIKALTGQPSFQANPSRVNSEKQEILFSHCTLPLNMCTNYELMTHFESGLGIGIRGTLYKKQISIAKITPNLKNMIFLRGNIEENTTLPNYCRSQIVVKMDTLEFFTILNQKFGNHVAIVYNDIGESLIPFLEYYNLGFDY
ncbi:MAG: hypothetical protein MJ225_02210 [Bacilli bacterium]|nr:hypothetical protein [Bacilli bacterium]